MKLNFFVYGNKKQQGIFEYLEDDNSLVFLFANKEKPISKEEFIRTFGESYTTAHTGTVSLDKPKEYFDGLKYRFRSGYSWVEEI